MYKTAVYFVFLAFALGATEGTSKSLGQECDIHKIYDACGLNERCISKENKTYCICQRHFVESDGECVEIFTVPAASVDQTKRRANEESTSSGNSIAIGLLVPTLLILIGGVGFCYARRYRLLPCQQNRYGNVLVTRDEDDDDDPPIA